MAEELKDKQKKVLLGYNECAREIQKANPLVAFYCRMYGVEQALSFGTKDMNAGIRNFIEAEFVDLEKTKPTLGISAATREADAETCREFAKTVFNAADKRDRSGLPEHILPAAISFKRAAQFFNVATQFGPLPDTYAQLKKYALWRSLELTKAHKEGRAPEPPPQAQLEEDADRDLMAALNALPAVPGAGASSEDVSTSFMAPPPAQSPPPAQGNFNFSFPEPPTNQPEVAAAVAPSPPQAPPVVLPPPPPLVSPPSEPAYRAPDSLFQPPPVSTLPPGAVPAQAPPRTFQPGEHVKFCPDATVNCIKEEAIVQHVFPGQYGEPAYSVYLVKRKQHVTVPGELLAPVIDTGSRMVFYPEDGGGPQEVEVEEIYASRWPPTYLVMSPGRGLLEVEDDRLIKPPPPPQQATVVATAAVASPPVLATQRADVEADLAAERAIAAALAEAALEERERRNYGDDLSAILEGTEIDDDGDTEDGDIRSVSTSVAAEEIAAEALASASPKQHTETESAAEPSAQINHDFNENEDNKQHSVHQSPNSHQNQNSSPGAGADLAGFAPGGLEHRPGTYPLPPQTDSSFHGEGYHQYQQEEHQGYDYHQEQQQPPAGDVLDSLFVEDTMPPPVSPLAGGPIPPPPPSEFSIEPPSSHPEEQHIEHPQVYDAPNSPGPVEKPTTVYYPTYESPQMPPTMPPLPPLPPAASHFVEPGPSSYETPAASHDAYYMQQQAYAAAAPGPSQIVAPPIPVAVAPVPAAPAVQYAYDPNYEPPMETMLEAQKVTKSAASALSFEDVPTAVKYLQDALNMLTQPGAQKPGRKR